MEDFFAGIPSEGGEVAFNEEVGPTPVDSQSQKDQEEKPKDASSSEDAKTDEVKKPAASEKSSDEENTPWHKDPRFKKRMDRFKSDTKTLQEENAKLRSDMDEFRKRFDSLSQTQKQEAAIQLPQEFVQLFGENADAWTPFQKLIAQEAQKIVKGELSSMEAARNAQAEQQRAANTFIEKQLVELSDEFGIDFMDNKSNVRNGVLKIAQEYLPTDENGNVSLKKAYTIWKAMNPQKEMSESRKKAASLSSESSVEPAGQTEETVQKLGSLKNKTWRDFVKNS